MQELEREKRKAVEANIEQLNSVRRLREEAMDAKKNEVNAAIERLEKVLTFIAHTLRITNIKDVCAVLWRKFSTVSGYRPHRRLYLTSYSVLMVSQY